MRQNIFLLFFLSICFWGKAQLPKLSDQAQISVMTCGAGDALYYAFGHSAFRVQDSTIGLDVVYNYGTFDFDKPNFYLNFAKGKLVYSLSRRSFENFLYEYELEKRWVKEQILDLDKGEVNDMFAFFEDNYKPENRDYLYDPLFNNCSNITAVILKKQFGDAIDFNGDHLDIQYSFREIVRQFISLNSWGSFGIELSFGSITDKTATVEQHMFSPYYAMYQLKNTTKNGQPLLKRERTILDYPELKENGTFMTSPLFWFLFLLLLIWAITYLDWKHGTRHRWLDFTLFLISGLAGTLVFLLWIATDHEVTKLNFNFLWLLPSNAVVAFYLLNKQAKINWLKKYLWIALACIGLIMIIWIFGIQVLSPLNIPLMLILIARYLLLLKRA